jgi:hypothetical protein
MTLVGTRIGQTEQRDFQVESYTMQEDPVRYLVRVVFDKCHQISSSDENDLRLVPKLIRQYLTHLNTDETTWKQYVQAHAPEMIDDIKDQISAHVVEETEITWADTGEAVTWSSWKKSVLQGYTPPHFSTVSARESRRQLLTGYTKTIYTEAEFDSTQEKLLADILERDSTITSWLRLPTGQMPILYAGGEYNPDFIADDGTTMYLLEIKSAAEVTDSRVQRKASAARDWCRVAATVSGRPWMYKLIPHDDLLATDSFTGVISKSYNLPEPVVGSPEPTTSTNPEEDETGTQASPPPHTE